MYHIVKRKGVNRARLKIRDGRRGSALGRGQREGRRPVGWNCRNDLEGAGGGRRRTPAEALGGGDRNAARQGSPLSVQPAQCRSDHAGSGNRPLRDRFRGGDHRPCRARPPQPHSPAQRGAAPPARPRERDSDGGHLGRHRPDHHRDGGKRSRRDHERSHRLGPAADDDRHRPGISGLPAGFADAASRCRRACVGEIAAACAGPRSAPVRYPRTSPFAGGERAHPRRRRRRGASVRRAGQAGGGHVRGGPLQWNALRLGWTGRARARSGGAQSLAPARISGCDRSKQSRCTTKPTREYDHPMQPEMPGGLHPRHRPAANP